MDNFLDDILLFRRKLHRIPEVAGKEKSTCAAIREKLSEIPGVRVLKPFLETDTVAFIDGAAPGRNVTLRADIDALPVDEKSGVEFSSGIPGMMHACGHDVHTAILAGCAKLLAAKRNEFSGSIRLVFQPGEECIAMAKDLVSAGALTKPAPDFVSALHVEPGLPLGTIGVKSGAMASACLHYRVTFCGRGGHGSAPHKSRSPIMAAVAAINELQYVVNTRIDPQRAALISVCSISGGGNSENVIPNECFFGGTLRALDNETAEDLREALYEVCNSVAAAHRLKCEVNVSGYYPAVINPESGADLAIKVAEKSKSAVKKLTESAMSSEDFSYFLMNSPDGVFVRLGIGENLPPLYNPGFIVPEEVIPLGIDYMCKIALAALNK